jgi:hypothetical protein
VDDMPLARAPDAQVEQGVPHLLADGNQCIGAPGKSPFHPDERLLHTAVEVPLEDVPVERVHHNGTRTDERSSDTADGTRLGHMSVEEPRTTVEQQGSGGG